ncbi:MAG: hypothetical protein IKL97_03740, partial [Eggerthellaceae bacterium]|nr:hypothetical protein [Eggerthellaceae bacterium]
MYGGYAVAAFKRMRKNNDDARLLGDKVSRCGKLAPVSGFEMNFQCGGMIHMEYGDYLAEQGNADKFSGAAQLYAILAGEYSYIQPFVVLYVPLYVRFQASAALRATIDAGVGVTKDEGKFHLSDGASFSLNLKIVELAVTLGVGVADVVSVGVRGLGYISAFMGVYFESPKEGKPNPRLSLEGGADVSVVLQAFMFKGSVKLYSFTGVIADNWAASQAARLASGEGADVSSASDAGSAYAMRLPGGGVGHPIPNPLVGNGGLLRGGSPSTAFSDNAVPVTASELMSSVEFTATPKRAVLRSGKVDGALPPQHDLYSYEPVRRDGRGLGTPSSGLQSLGSGGAVVAGGTMHEGAYSDPRLKVVVVDGEPWMLRILSVNYGTAESPQVRTRLSVARWVFDSGDGESLADGLWESAQVIDFEPVYGGVQVSEGQGGVSATPQRIDLYDYDYSVL